MFVSRTIAENFPTSTSVTVTPNLHDYYYLNSLLSLLLQYCRLYGAQILFMIILSTLAAFRREMSCNHVYQEEDGREEEGDYASPSYSKKEERNDDDAATVLEEAGYFCSGGPFVDFLLTPVWAALLLLEDYQSVSKIANPCCGVAIPNRSPVSTDILSSGEHNITPAKNFNFSMTSIYRPVHYPLSASPSIRNPAQPNTTHQTHGSQLTPAIYLTSALPPEIQIHMVTFLSAKEITTLSCVSRSTNNLIDGENNIASFQIWSRIFQRDYRMVTEWNVARDALRKSLHEDIAFDFSTYLSSHYQSHGPFHAHSKIESMKELYFTFGETWIDWSIAGKNTMEECYVGLHNGVYDITHFIPSHPGSPETLLVHSGREATRFFEDMGHSKTAKQMAKDFRIVYLGEGGIPSGRLETTVVPNLERVRRKLEREYAEELRKVECWTDKYGTQNIVGDVLVYYDPFLDLWRWWYTDISLQPVFMHSVSF